MVKGKVVSVHVMKALGGAEIQIHSFLTSALDALHRGEWSNSLRGHFAPAKRTPVPI
jgi:hypothetical protein